MNQQEYERLKRSVSGFYQKFNTQVLKWHMNKIFHYEYLLETVNEFETFESYFDFHTRNKKELIAEHTALMLKESKVPDTTWDKAYTCIVVRLGNIYNGIVMETKIIRTLNQLTEWISCVKTEKEIDTNYKVDGIITLANIDQIAVQIKPFSFTYYGLGSETTFHNQFEVEFGTKVHYIFYKENGDIVFNGKQVRLNETENIVEIIESLAGLQLYIK